MSSDSQDQTLEDPTPDVAEFDVGMLLPVGMTIIVFAIGIAYGLNVMEDVQDDMGADACNSTYSTYVESTKLCSNGTASVQPMDSTAFNATKDGVISVSKFPDKLGLIVTVIIAAVVIGILVRYLFVRYG